MKIMYSRRIQEDTLSARHTWSVPRDLSRLSISSTSSLAPSRRQVRDEEILIRSKIAREPIHVTQGNKINVSNDECLNPG